MLQHVMLKCRFRLVVSAIFSLDFNSTSSWNFLGKDEGFLNGVPPEVQRQRFLSVIRDIPSQ